MRVDLHTHTNASDGQHTPTELVAMARDFDWIAITDHDTTDGIAEARAAAAAQGSPAIIVGIEFSCEDSAGDVHMLGYHLTIDHPPLQALLTDLRDTRERRAVLMLEKLAEQGVILDWERVAALADGAIGRPHIARALVEAGYVESVREAFNRYIGSDCPAYVPRRRLSPEESIAAIHDAGGVAVLAHPGVLSDPLPLIDRLLPAGLDGVEVMHPSNTGALRDQLRVIAKQHDLVMTGGSDFHGAAVKPGIGIGCETPPAEAVACLRERAVRYAKPG